MTTTLVYDAESEVRNLLKRGGTIEAFGSTLTLPIERKFGDIAGVQRYVNLVWEREATGDAPTVRPRRGWTKAHYQRLGHEIAVPDHIGSHSSWAMREMVVLHEIAHGLTSGGHGPDFCRAFTNLVGIYIGAEVEFLLKTALWDRGVQIASTTV